MPGAETPDTNPTGVPMHLENGMWIPGEQTGTNNVNVLQNANPTITIGSGLEGGRAAATPVEAAPIAVGVAATEAAAGRPDQMPTTPEAVEDPKFQQLQERIDQLANQLAEQNAQILALLQQLINQNAALQAPEAVAAPANGEEPTAIQVVGAQPAEQAGGIPGEEPAPAEGLEDDNANQLQEGADQEAQAGQEEAARRLERAEAELKTAGENLNRVIIRRSARSVEFLTSSAREDRETYPVLLAEYQGKLHDFLEAKRASLENDALNDPDQGVLDPNRADDIERDIKRQLEILKTEKLIELRRNEVEINAQMLKEAQEQGGVKGLMAKVAHRWSNIGRGKRYMIAVAVGLGVGVASGPLGLGVGMLIAGGAVKASLGILNKQASLRNVSESTLKKDIARIENRAKRSMLSFDDGLDLESYNSELVANTGEDTDDLISRRKRRNRIGNAILLAGMAGTALGGLELAGGVHLPYSHKISDIWNHHDSGPSGGGGPTSGGGEDIPGFGEHTTAELPGGAASHVSLEGINPNTITAHTPAEFQDGVLKLLDKQGLAAHGATPEKLQKMSEWMQNNPIATGMKSATEQNLTGFPSGGQEFANANLSAEQGFRIGADGTGRQALYDWIRQAEKTGISFTRKS